MAARFNRRRSSSRNASVSDYSIRFETLEARNMLAADFGIVDPFSSSLITTIENDVPVIQQMNVLRDHLNAQPNDTFDLIDNNQDQLGFDHFKYQHYHNGIEVESSTYTVHTKDGLIVSLSGEYHEVSTTATQPAISESNALDFALDHINANSYIWQDAQFQQSLQLSNSRGNGSISLGQAQDTSQHLKGISFETPQAEMVYSGNSLTYRFDIYALEPLSRSWIFVDAFNGEIVDQQSQIHDFDLPGNGPSLYDGSVVFTADFTGTEYRLREVASGGPVTPGVQTYDLNGSTNYGSAVDFTSTSAVFNDPDHPVGNQTHFSTEQTWAYFFNRHGRNSYDDLGTPLVSYVSYNVNYVNAFWNGSFMTYGDGNGTNRGPLVSLDIAAHEVAHGVTQFSAGLIYKDHSGALNESFSDIFGESVENYARGTNDWLMGGDIGLNGNAGQFRSMADPNVHNDPDTYLGDYWHVGNSDQGGVHTNSGVQNKWYYIMVNGEAGTNDTGHTYNVTGVGIIDAGAIAYRNLTQYLSANSTYPDARVGAIQSAIDLFGVGSQQHLSTMAAWDAVGVYDFSEVFTLTPVVPLGSQIYSASAINNIEYESDSITFDLDLDANQIISLTVANLSGDLLPHVTITAPGGLVLADFVAPTIADTVVIENLPAPAAGTYTITVDGDAATIGSFEANLLLNAGLEHESLGIVADNDILANAQDIDLTAITQGYLPTSLVDRLAVTGDLLGGGVVIGGDDFESGSLDGSWETFSSTPNGRILVTNDTGTPNGLFALAMDVDTAGIFNLNEAIQTLDLTDVSVANLEFSHVSFGDETHILPAAFGGSFNGDGVSISEDGLIWYTVWTNDSPPNGVWEDVQLDLVQAADDAGITLGIDFKIKFQQYDNFPRNSDGRAFDNIQVGLAPLEDWYSFTLGAGESATIVLTQTGGTAAVTDLEIYDLSESLLASGTTGLNDIRSFVEGFVNPGIADETYYIRALGSSELYSLVVTRGATFDVEHSYDQNITGLEGVLGYVSESIQVGAEPDAAATGDVVDTFFPGVTLSNAISGGSIYAVQAGNFDAPTGLNVFSRTGTNDSGFREGNHEFRADFDNPQSYVSIDVGSDDTLDVAFLRAYDAGGTLLQEVIGAGVAHSESETLIIQRPVADIAYVIAAGRNSDTAPLDNLVFEDQIVDADTYEIDALIGDEIEYRSWLPGEGPFEFENRLDQPGGKEIRMILVDPLGSTVATDSHIVSHTAEMDGTYQLIVFANKFDGEYFVSRDTGIAVVGAFGAKFLDGFAAGGSLSDAGLSDDVMFMVDPSPTTNPQKQIIDMILLAESPVFSPTSFGFRLEATMNGGPTGDVIQIVQLWDETGGIWETVDTRSIADTETVIDVGTFGNLDRFVHPLNREIIARITFESPSFAGTPFNWSIDIDQAVWRIGQY